MLVDKISLFIYFLFLPFTGPPAMLAPSVEKRRDGKLSVSMKAASEVRGQIQ